MKRLTDAELTQESITASQVYLKKTQQEGLGLVEKNRIANSVAHGFYMGVRWIEDRNKKENIDEAGDENGTEK